MPFLRQSVDRRREICQSLSVPPSSVSLFSGWLSVAVLVCFTASIFSVLAQGANAVSKSLSIFCRSACALNSSSVTPTKLCM